MRANAFLLAGSLLLATLLTGCVSQLQGAPEADAENLEQQSNPAQETIDRAKESAERSANTSGLKPPIARMQIFSGQGALVFQSNFVAENADAKHVFDSGETITFLAAISEAIEPGTQLRSYSWEFGDGQRATGKTVTHAYEPQPVGKVYTTTLTVTDDRERSDSVSVRVAVFPSEQVLVTDPRDGYAFLGAYGVMDQAVHIEGGDFEDFPFEILAEREGKLLLPRHVKLSLSPIAPTASNLDLLLLTESGVVLAQQKNPGAVETIEFPGDDLAPGNLTARVIFTTGAWAPMGDTVPTGPTYTLTIEVLYQVTTRELNLFLA